MGCNSCKDKEKLAKLSVYKNDGLAKEQGKKSIGFIIFEYSIKTIIFAIMMVLSPLIILFVWYMLFKTIILGTGSVSLMPFLVSVGKALKIGTPKINYDDDDDYEDLDVTKPEDYELAEPAEEIRLN